MNTDTKEEVVLLYLDDIIPNRFQPREVFDDKALKELAISIKEHGVIQPIIVRSVNGKYEIIAGERRYKASALAGLTKIPAIVRNIDDKETSKVALLENLQRKNLNAIEEARTYQKILELDEMTQEELAKTMGKSQSAVANKLRLLALPIEIQDALLKEQISERHARTLLGINDEKLQKTMLKNIIANKLTVRQVEEEIKKNKTGSDDINKASDYLNSNPLNPSLNIAQMNEEQGVVTIKPPEGSEEMSQFINYGEIDDDIDDNDNDNDSYELPSNFKNIDIDSIKENATDIMNQTGATTGGTDLDSLLNINQNNPSDDFSSPDLKFITPAEAIIKNDEKNNNSNKEDYFQTPDLVNINIPNVNNKKNSNDSFSLTNQPEVVQGVTPQNAIFKLKETIEELKNNNVKIEVNEMNFSSSYQVIIKIEK